MFSQLHHLYRQHTSKTPLEDFTTEAFVGILNLHPIIKEKFIEKFLKLPPDNYVVRTQVYYPLMDDNDNFVDVVIESDNLLCFIENKVESSEGHRQLIRYCKVLDEYKEKGIQTRLFYCTKYHENKTLELDNHQLELTRWYKIASFLQSFKSKPLVHNFLKFLKEQKMSQELTINSIDYVTFENLQKTTSLVIDYLDRARPLFEKKFGKNNVLSDGWTFKNIRDHNRLIFYYKEVILGTGWSELKYGFRFDQPRIFIDIYIDKKHDQHDLLLEAAKAYNENESEAGRLYISKIEGYGSALGNAKEISAYLNDDDAEKKILDWYKSAFDNFERFINSTEGINWK